MLTETEEFGECQQKVPRNRDSHVAVRWRRHARHQLLRVLATRACKALENWRRRNAAKMPFHTPIVPTVTSHAAPGCLRGYVQLGRSQRMTLGRGLPTGHSPVVVIEPATQAQHCRFARKGLRGLYSLCFKRRFRCADKQPEERHGRQGAHPPHAFAPQPPYSHNRLAPTRTRRFRIRCYPATRPPTRKSGRMSRRTRSRLDHPCCAKTKSRTGSPHPG